MKSSPVLLLLIQLLLFFSCSNPSQSNEADLSFESNIPDEFLYFLDEFHSDLSFQKQHIVWPLQGLPAAMDTAVADTFRWQEDDWVMHQSFDPENEEFDQSFTLLGDDLIVERIIHINKSLGMERRFARRDSSWNLIYYAGMNFLRKE